MTNLISRSALVILAMSAMTVGAEAHPGHLGAHGLLAGFVHPFTGFDHMLAMVAVGVLAARLGGRSLWAVPASFVALMVMGTVWAVAGLPLMFVETGILLSMVVLPAVALLRWKTPMAAALGLVGFFAVFHGYAHGLEMPSNVSGFEYAAGFVAATAFLHGVGLALGQLKLARAQA